MTDTNTKEIILDAAEKLFADKGFGATSLRAIIKYAGVNTASIHYHFGSKEGLIEAVIARRARSINIERIARLDLLEASHPIGELPLEGVVKAFIGPVFGSATSQLQRSILPRLMGRCIFEPNQEYRNIVFRVFHEVVDRFTAAFNRALPDLSKEELEWRVHFMIGAMAFTMATEKRHGSDDHRQPPSATDLQERTDGLIRFVTAGMQAECTTNSGKATR